MRSGSVRGRHVRVSGLAGFLAPLLTATTPEDDEGYLAGRDDGGHTADRVQLAAPARTTIQRLRTTVSQTSENTDGWRSAHVSRLGMTAPGR